jgi:hypothetical protein
MTLRDYFYRLPGLAQLNGLVQGRALARHDAQLNRRWATADERFLVVRHAGDRPHFYDVLLNWLETHYPRVRARFELQQITCHIRDWKPYVLHVPWLQDPVQAWSPTAYKQANRLATACRARAIPIVNPVDRLTNAGKEAGARTIGAMGIRTARIMRITDRREFRETRYGFDLPLIVREDWRHGGFVCRADTPAEFRRIPLWKFKRPIVMEFIDVRDPHDGLCRKYRYVAAGDWGVPQSMHPCKSWFAKGSYTEFNDRLRDEEVAFISRPDPSHERLQAARRALGLDFLAFDYSYDRDGQLVVWEANPYPLIHFGSHHRQHRWPAVRRVLAAMARLYLERAGLDVPPGLAEELEFCASPAGAQAA